MTQTIVNIRKLVESVYPSFSWKAKVQKMSDEQITAIYLSFKKRGVLK